MFDVNDVVLFCTMYKPIIEKICFNRFLMEIKTVYGLVYFDTSILSNNECLCIVSDLNKIYNECNATANQSKAINKKLREIGVV